MRQEQRKARIIEIGENIKQVLGAGMKVDKKKLVFSMMSKYGMSEKIVLEYLNVSMFEIGKPEDKVFEGLKQVKL